ncbi:hypothetical protein AeRB84_018173 [Aphanomyces euteiches]|nr:hypothetical protein AeRB84_018173 [Aphanomyces euteiches]
MKPNVSEVSKSLDHEAETKTQYDESEQIPSDVVVKREVSNGADNVDADTEVEVPSFQLLNLTSFQSVRPQSFNDHSMDQSVFHRDETDAISLKYGDYNHDAPSFNLLSSNVPRENISALEPKQIPPQDGSFQDSTFPPQAQTDFQSTNVGITNSDYGDHDFSKQFKFPDSLNSSRQAQVPPKNSDEARAVTPFNPPTEISHEKNNKSLRQAGLDDSSSSEEEVHNARKLRRTKNRDVLHSREPGSSVKPLNPAQKNAHREWSCPRCTYLNEETTIECECCGQLKASPAVQTINLARSPINSNTISNDDTALLVESSDDEHVFDSPAWICKMCTYENHKNPERCELCDTPKGSSKTSQPLFEENDNFYGGSEEEFEVTSDFEGNIVDLTSTKTPRKSFYESDSIEEESDTQVAPYSKPPLDIPDELREFSSFIPVASLRSQPDSIDYLGMFGANRGGKSYSDRLQKRIAESRRRKNGKDQGVSENARGKRKKGGKKGKKSSNGSRKESSGRSSFAQFQKASSVKVQFQKSSRGQGPVLLDSNLKPKQKTRSMQIASDEGGDFGGFRSSRYAHHSAPVEASRMATWEGQGSVRYDDD